jgi:hypothetical protein
MFRIIIVNLLLLLLPTAIYLSYVYLRGQGRARGEMLSNAPIFWLLAAGVALMIAVLIFFGKWHNGGPGQRYIPPAIKDGVIQPGRVE